MKYLNNRGYALFLTVSTILLISTLGLSLFTVTANSNKTTVNERYDQSVYYIAESGINLEKAKIAEVLTGVYDSLISSFNQLTYEEQKSVLDQYGSFENYFVDEIKKQFCNSYNGITNSTKCTIDSSTGTINFENLYNFSEQFGERPVAKTTIKGEYTSGYDKSFLFTLESQGYFENSKKNPRTLTQTLTVDINAPLPDGGPGSSTENEDGNGNATSGNPLSNIAAITNGDISLINGPKINGNAASLNGNITLIGGSEITGSTALPPNASSIKLEDYLPEFPNQKFDSLSKLTYPKNEEISADPWNKTNIIENGHFKADSWIANNYTLTLDKDTRFKNFIVSSNNTITIDIGNNIVNLYADSFDISQGHINIIGSGTINLYIKDTINIRGSFNPYGDPNKVNIFYQGTKPTIFSDETQVYGSFYTNSADLTLTGGAGFYGNLYVGGHKLEISGGVPTNGQYIIAPHADLRLSGGGNITGTVIANSIYAEGGTSISYGKSEVPLPNEPNVPTPPFEYQPAQSLIKESVMNEK